jgi:predicted GIY-YIG superfamily endonuclease
VYILRSEETGRYYVGSLADPWRRLGEQNAGKGRSTKAWGPWELVAAEAFETASEAQRAEDIHEAHST